MRNQLNSSVKLICLVILLTSTFTVQIADQTVNTDSKYDLSPIPASNNLNENIPAKSTSALTQTAVDSPDEPELLMADLASHLNQQFLREEGGFRPTPSYQGTTLIGTAYGVISLRYFGIEAAYIEGEATLIQEFTYNHSKSAEDMYWFTNTIGGPANIRTTWAGISILYTFNNLSNVDLEGVANYINQFRDSSGGYNETAFSYLESTYWAIETLRLIDPLVPGDLLTPAMIVETRTLLLNQLDQSNYQFNDPSQDDTVENYQLSTFFALMTLQVMNEHHAISDFAINISQWINSTQYYPTEIIGEFILPTNSPLTGGFSERTPSSEENTRLIPTAAALASIKVLNETVSDNLFLSIINTTQAENFIIRSNIAGGGISDSPEGDTPENSLENVYFVVLGLLSSGKLLDLLNPLPIFYPMPQNQMIPIVRGDDVSIMFYPNIYNVGPHEGLELEVTLDEKDFGLVERNENATIPDTYQLNLTRADFPDGMFLGNHTLVTNMSIINPTFFTPFTTTKISNMTVGLQIQFDVANKTYTPSEVIPITGTLTDRLSDNLNGNITALLVDPLGNQLDQAQMQASNGVFSGSIQIPNAPLLGNHSLGLKFSNHTVNTTLVYVNDQTILSVLSTNSFEGPGSTAFHLGDNTSVIAQIRYKTTKDIPNAYVPNLNGSFNLMYTNKSLFSDVLNETSTPGSYNITIMVPDQLITGSLNITATIEWPNIPETTTSPIEMYIVTNFELAERQGFTSPLSIQYGQQLNLSFKVHELISDRTIEFLTLSAGFTNLTSSDYIQELSYTQENATFQITDIPDTNILQGSYNLHIKGQLIIDESYIDLITPIPVTLSGQLKLDKISILSGTTINLGQDLVVDFIIINTGFENTEIDDLLLVSTITGPEAAYTINHTHLGFPPQLMWNVPEDAPFGNYTTTLFRNADMLVVGTFDFEVVPDIIIKEPRPWQFYAVIVFSVFEAVIVLAFIREIRKRKG